VAQLPFSVAMPKTPVTDGICSRSGSPGAPGRAVGEPWKNMSPPAAP
jgi:hypothetical protein